MRSSALLRALRVCSLLGVAAVLIDAVLLSTGLVSWPVALLLLLAVELPLLVAALVLHVLLYRGARRAGSDRSAAWEALLAANPPLRLIQAETGQVVGLVRDLVRLARGDHRGPNCFGSASGTLTMPVCLTVVLLVETVAVHLLVPWPWLRLVLLLGNAYAVLLVCSVLVGRVANPHRLVGDRLRLQHGRHLVAEVPLAQLDAAPVISRSETWLAVSGGTGQSGHSARTLHLATQFGTNVRLRPAEPVLARIPRALGPDQRHQVDEIHLMVDDPEPLLRAVAATDRGVVPPSM